MPRFDDEEDMFFESVGRIRRRGDDSRSPSATGQRDRSRSADRRDGNQSNHRQHRTTSSQESIIPSTSSTIIDSYRAQHQAIPRGRPLLARGDLDNHGTEPTSNTTVSPMSHKTRQSNTKDDASRQPTKVKEPNSDSDLTEDEFERYQARYGLRHKTSASQITQGTSNEDADDPTLGNHRTQMRLSEDGTIERRDFDWRGGFRYDMSEQGGGTGKGKGKG